VSVIDLEGSIRADVTEEIARALDAAGRDHVIVRIREALNFQSVIPLVFVTCKCGEVVELYAWSSHLVGAMAGVLR
jgi:hypothetical protein